MGFDKQMVKTLTGIEVPADGRSFDAGVLVNNVGTALAVWQAVAEGRPLVSRLVTRRRVRERAGQYRRAAGRLG